MGCNVVFDGLHKRGVSQFSAKVTLIALFNRGAVLAPTVEYCSDFYYLVELLSHAELTVRQQSHNTFNLS